MGRGRENYRKEQRDNCDEPDRRRNSLGEANDDGGSNMMIGRRTLHELWRDPKKNLCDRLNSRMYNYAPENAFAE